MNYSEIKNKTHQKFESKDFKVGDIFSEMLSYWEVIIKIEDDTLYVMQRISDKLEIRKFTKDEYVKHCKYHSGIGYWIDFMKNDTDKIKFYVEAFIEQEEMTLDKIREFKLDLVL